MGIGPNLHLFKIIQILYYLLYIKLKINILSSIKKDENNVNDNEYMNIDLFIGKDYIYSTFSYSNENNSYFFLI